MKKESQTITKLQNESKKLSTTETFKGNIFYLFFQYENNFQMEKRFDKTMKNRNETMENELIMMIFIFFTMIKSELIFKVP